MKSPPPLGAFFPKPVLVWALVLLLPGVLLPAQEPGGVGGSAGAGGGAPGLLSGVTERDSLYAREEFRIGVQAYNRFAFNEAILSFERALSFRPGEPLILDWLGRAYYRSGLEDIALSQWQAAADGYNRAGAGDTLVLAGRIETVRNRRSFLPQSGGENRYVEAGRFPGRYDNVVAFRQPSAVLPLEDGSAWVVAYGSNEIIRIDVNGLIRERRRGPLNGFDRPYDLVRGLDGRFYLSEFRGGRVSVLGAQGEWLSYIGSKGLGAGQLVGPQNLAIDEAGYLYVVEYGNRRISKFDPDGLFIHSFGIRDPGFPGLLSPTGIAAGGGRVFVADGIAKQIYSFDGNGAYLGVLVREGLTGPESLRFFPDGRLLVSDTNRILLVDINSAAVTELGVAGNSRVRIIGAGADQNGNILVANFGADEVLVMTPIDDMASGLFVQIDRVVSDNFPLVTVEIQVQDRQRRPIVGLDGKNFLLSEEGRAVSEQNFLYAGYRAAAGDVSVLMERSPASAALGDDLATALRDISASVGRIVSLVAASEQPYRESLGTAPNSPPASTAAPVPARLLAEAARGSAAAYTPRWRFDLGLRLAATDLLPAAKKRAVVFVGTGRLGELAFEQYGLSELAAYLANNGIVFHAVILGGNPADREIEYLCAETGGQVLPLYRPEGIGYALENLKLTPSGSYILNYRSLLSTDFGRAYLPVEAEVYLLERSGRDSTGYFPPIE
ncbi:MAG: NHL repeat-containing protein [Spirochaetaceae bacterium]|jgi:DNA-binding beta-propeller fold protein YncE|nr:NHL repeat-containing protein [Spirochaetaceae bacterium]